MTLVKWKPNSYGVNVLDSFDTIFDNIFNNTSNLDNWSPGFSVKEENKEYNINADMPGIDKKDISIEVEDGVLHLSGERRAINDDEGCYGYGRYGKFSRSFNLPDNCTGDNISAKLKNGVLNIILPKIEKVRNVKKINIK